MKSKGATLKYIGFLVIVTVVLLTVASKLTSAKASTSLEDNEAYMITLINQERLANNLSSLDVDPTLAKMAKEHSRDMVKDNYFSHTSPASGDILKRIQSTGLDGWVVAGENIAGASSVDTAFDALMKSKGHRDNLLNPDYTHVGVGIVNGGKYGKTITQEFAQIEEKDWLITQAKASRSNKGLNISFELQEPAYVTVAIYNAQGNLVDQVEADNLRQGGLSEVSWDGQVNESEFSEGKASGKYEYRVLARSVLNDYKEKEAGVVTVPEAQPTVFGASFTSFFSSLFGWLFS